MSDLVRGYVEAAGIGKRGACHRFRHSIAALILENSADIPCKQMLGHAELNTSQIYTKVSIPQLKRIYSATQPARLEQKPHAGEDATAHEPAGSFGQQEGN